MERIRFRLSVALALLMLGALGFPARGDSQDVRERLNKILYWSVSDELKLTQSQEKRMIETIESVQRQREQAFKDREAALGELRKLPKDATPAKAKESLDRFQKAVDTLTRLEGEEYAKLLEIFGAQTLARFYVIRDDVAQRVRDALKKSDSPAPKN